MATKKRKAVKPVRSTLTDDEAAECLAYIATREAGNIYSRLIYVDGKARTFAEAARRCTAYLRRHLGEIRDAPKRRRKP